MNERKSTNFLYNLVEVSCVSFHYDMRYFDQKIGETYSAKYLVCAYEEVRNGGRRTYFLKFIQNFGDKHLVRNIAK